MSRLCPSCKLFEFTLLHLSAASLTSPVRCTRCAAQLRLREPTWLIWTAAFVGQLVAIAALLAIFAFGPLVTLVICTALFSAYVYLRALLGTLEIVTAEQLRRSQARTLWVLAALVVAMIIVGVVGG